MFNILHIYIHYLIHGIYFLFFSYFFLHSFFFNTIQLHTDIKTYDVMIHALSKVNYSPAGTTDHHHHHQQPSPTDAFGHLNSSPPPHNALNRAKVCVSYNDLFFVWLSLPSKIFIYIYISNILHIYELSSWITLFSSFFHLFFIFFSSFFLLFFYFFSTSFF